MRPCNAPFVNPDEKWKKKLMDQVKATQRHSHEMEREAVARMPEGPMKEAKKQALEKEAKLMKLEQQEGEAHHSPSESPSNRQSVSPPWVLEKEASHRHRATLSRKILVKDSNLVNWPQTLRSGNSGLPDPHLDFNIS